eukprot:6320096-Amphidinium_carterae.1
MYGRGKPNTLMVWRQLIVAHIRRASMGNGMYNLSIYFRRAEDISIEFVPNHMEANHHHAANANNNDKREQCSMSETQRSNGTTHWCVEH